jgi:hypothetical protein
LIKKVGEKMGIFKKYNIERNNNKMLIQQLSIKNADCVKWQKENMKLKEEIAKLKIQVEDTISYLEQEKKLSNALRKERAILKGKVTKLSKKGE